MEEGDGGVEDPATWYLGCEEFGHVFYSGACLDCGLSSIEYIDRRVNQILATPKQQEEKHAS
jgi:hypothetical protein